MSNIKVSYWCPFISKVATIKAVTNSVLGLQNYSKNTIKPEIINVFGEWDEFKEEFEEKNIVLTNKLINISFIKFNHTSFFVSRIKYILIFIFGFIPLISYLKKNKPNFLIIHLVTSLPLFIFTFFNFNTKLILRISGFPKLNYHRKMLWKLSSRNIYKITCPTIETHKTLNKFPYLKNKITILRDPIISVKDILNKRREKLKINLPKKKFILTIGRLTNQKNYIFLIESFSQIKNNSLDLIILGSGEDKEKLLKKINELKLVNRIHLIDYTNNVFNLIKECEFFVLTSLWEDPGFVLIEAAFMNKIILSSNCPSGPKEILCNGKNGFLFESDDYEDFKINYNNVINADENELKIKVINAKKFTKNFTIFRHYINLVKILKI
jgi:glycosyltransferase involved in cell wall biosynthesis